MDRIRLKSVSNPLDADLIRLKSTAKRILDEILTGNTSLLVLYDEDNSPNDIKMFKININEI